MSVIDALIPCSLWLVGWLVGLSLLAWLEFRAFNTIDCAHLPPYLPSPRLLCSPLLPLRPFCFPPADCPAGAPPDSSCQSATSTAILQLTDEDPAAVTDAFAAAMAEAIAAGRLDDALRRYNPATEIASAGPAPLLAFALDIVKRGSNIYTWYLLRFHPHMPCRRPPPVPQAAGGPGGSRRAAVMAVMLSVPAKFLVPAWSPGSHFFLLETSRGTTKSSNGQVCVHSESCKHMQYFS